MRDIKILEVRCANIARGCEWIECVGTLEEHVAKCEYTLVECTNKCTAEQKTVSVMRKDLEHHVQSECPKRAYKCEFCSKKGTYASIMEYHDNLCLKKPVPCPNTDCTLTLERGRVKRHVASECEHTVVACKYNSIGCPEWKKRKDIRIHEEDDKIHLRLSLNKVSQLDGTVTELNHTVFQLNGAVKELNGAVEQLRVVVKQLTNRTKKEVGVSIDVPNFRERKRASDVFQSKPFLTFPSGYKMKFIVYCNGHGNGEGTHLSVYTQLLDVPYRDHLQWPFRGTVSVKLWEYETIIKYHNNEGIPDGDPWGTSCFLSLSSLRAKLALVTSLHVTLASVAMRSWYERPDDTLHFKLAIQENEEIH